MNPMCSLSAPVKQLIKTFVIPGRAQDKGTMLHCLVSATSDEDYEGYCIWIRMIDCPDRDFKMEYSYEAHSPNAVFVLPNESPADVVISVTRGKGPGSVFEIVDNSTDTDEVLFRIENTPHGPSLTFTPLLLPLDLTTIELLKNQEFMLNKIGEDSVVVSLLLSLLPNRDPLGLSLPV